MTEFEFPNTAKMVLAFTNRQLGEALVFKKAGNSLNELWDVAVTAGMIDKLMITDPVDVQATTGMAYRMRIASLLVLHNGEYHKLGEVVLAQEVANDESRWTLLAWGWLPFGANQGIMHVTRRGHSLWSEEDDYVVLTRETRCTAYNG